jgi:hypothetical protein
MNEITADEIAQNYSAIIASVTLINTLAGESAPYTDTLGDLQRNVDHLVAMRSKSYWTTEDFTAVDTSITTAGRRIKVVNTEGVARPDDRMTEAAQECSRRIYAIADATAQMNMASAASAGIMSTDQLDAWKQALFWVGQMRGTWRGLAADVSKIITDDANWPTCPVAAAALADGF